MGINFYIVHRKTWKIHQEVDNLLDEQALRLEDLCKTYEDIVPSDYVRQVSNIRYPLCCSVDNMQDTTTHIGKKSYPGHCKFTWNIIPESLQERLNEEYVIVSEHMTTEITYEEFLTEIEECEYDLTYAGKGETFF